MTTTITPARRIRSSLVQTICFHGIGTPGRPLEPGEERFWITEAVFHGILDAIAAHPRDIDITFDDANASDAVFGLPALVEHGMEARFFVITDRIDEPGSLSAAQLQQMAAAGMTFGTHGASHRPWPELAADDRLGAELDDSAARLAGITGAPVDHAAFPQGLYNRSVLAALRERHYRRAYSVDEGWSRRRAWLRSRYSVIHSDTVESITALLDNPNLTSDRWPVRTMKQTVKRWR